MSLAIGPMEEGHLDKLAELEGLCFSQPWSRQSLAEELGNPQACFLVCTQGQEVLGYGGMHFAAGEFFIDNIAVFPAHRRKGAGRAIVSAMAAFAQGHGGQSLSLEVRPSNTAAVALYHSLGFGEVGRRRGFYASPAEDALIMTLVLRG